MERESTAALVWLLLAGVISLLLLLSYYFSGTKKKKAKKETIPLAARDAPIRTGGRRPRRMRVNQHSDDEDHFGHFSDDEDVWVEDKLSGKIGAKKQRKLDMKAEKRENRQAEIEERDEKRKRDELLAAERRKKEELRQQDEAAMAEKERLRKEEQERKEHEEYLKIKEAFTIEESGDVGILTEEESQSLLQEFIDFVKTSKVILLEDLAAHFNLKTQEAIERLTTIQEMGRISGVMDDRGKFIYISEEELNNVAKFIKQRGRISIADLADSSNSLIKLQEEIIASKTIAAQA